jgi:hypothetical protein
MYREAYFIAPLYTFIIIVGDRLKTAITAPVVPPSA